MVHVHVVAGLPNLSHIALVCAYLQLAQHMPGELDPEDANVSLKEEESDALMIHTRSESTEKRIQEDSKQQGELESDTLKHEEESEKVRLLWPLTLIRLNAVLK